MYRIAVCDTALQDGQETVGTVQQLAAELRLEVTVDLFRAARPLYDTMKEKPYDLVLLETEIGGVNGIELARKLRFLYEDVGFIFVTSREEYALAAYSVFPYGYLLKRLTYRKLYEPFRFAVRNRCRQPALMFRTVEGGEVAVFENDLMYIEVFGNELDLHCKTGVMHCYGSLASAQESLPESRFYRSHRNFIVNMQYVQKIERFAFGMINGDKVTVAKNRYTEAREIFERYRNP